MSDKRSCSKVSFERSAPSTDPPDWSRWSPRVSLAPRCDHVSAPGLRASHGRQSAAQGDSAGSRREQERRGALSSASGRPDFVVAVAQTLGEAAGWRLRVGSELGHRIRHAKSVRADMVAPSLPGGHLRERPATFPGGLYATATVRSGSSAGLGGNASFRERARLVLRSLGVARVGDALDGQLLVAGGFSASGEARDVPRSARAGQLHECVRGRALPSTFWQMTRASM